MTDEEDGSEIADMALEINGFPIGITNARGDFYFDSVRCSPLKLYGEKPPVYKRSLLDGDNILSAGVNDYKVTPGKVCITSLNRSVGSVFR